MMQVSLCMALAELLHQMEVNADCNIRLARRKKLVQQKVTVKNLAGLHLKPAGILCQEAMKFHSSITFTYAKGVANAKSVLSVLAACVKCGDEILLQCDGVDEKEALDELVRLVESGLGEEG